MMANIFYFSDALRSTGRSLSFFFTVCFRIIMVLCRKRKEIQKVHFKYYNRFLFESSYLVIDYSFKNALWYNFKNIKKTVDAREIIFNLKNIPDDIIELRVVGLFRRKRFLIPLVIENAFQGSSFKTTLRGINSFSLVSNKINSVVIDPEVSSPVISFRASKAQIRTRRLVINHKSNKINPPILQPIDIL